MDVEQRSGEPNPNVAVIHEAMQHFPEGSWMRGALDHAAAELAVLHGRCQRAALAPPEGHVVVTRNEAGQAVAVTRQDGDGRILSVIAEFEAPEGYVLVPVEPTERMAAATVYNGIDYVGSFDMDDFRKDYAAMLAARPEVRP